MPAHLEQQQSTQMLRLPHQAAHQRPQHHQRAQPQRQPQARQMGAGQAQRPEASRAPAAPSALGPGPSFLGSAPVPFVRQPLEQALDSPEGERVQPAGRSCPGLAALCPVHLGSLQVHNHGRGCSLPPGATYVVRGMVLSNIWSRSAYLSLPRSIWPMGTSLLALVLLGSASVQSQGVSHPR